MGGAEGDEQPPAAVGPDGPVDQPHVRLVDVGPTSRADPFVQVLVVQGKLFPDPSIVGLRMERPRIVDVIDRFLVPRLYFGETGVVFPPLRGPSGFVAEGADPLPSQIRHLLRPSRAGDDLESHLDAQRKQDIGIFREAAYPILLDHAAFGEIGPGPFPPIRGDLGADRVRLHPPDRVPHLIQTPRAAGAVPRMDHAENNNLCAPFLFTGGRGRIGPASKR